MLIPSLEPDERLPAYVRRLLDKGFQHVVIVDDGSSAAYQPIFAELDAMDGVSVTHHELNRGKGCALKTGYAYIQAHFPAASGVITADADGQHTVEDCWHLAEVLTEGKRALYLGSRNFNLDHVPPKSRHGNKITSAVFRLLYGVYLPDTQTGLRAFRMADLPFMLDVPGERFEYEMQVLIACARAKLPMIPIEIETVYENENAGTHFHPIRDSYRINGIHHKIKFCTVQQFRNTLIFQILHQYSQFQIGINITETFRQNFRFGTSHSRVKGRKLTINITGLHNVCIHYCHTAYSCTTNHLGSIRPNST